jgi:hypothetical protein
MGNQDLSGRNLEESRQRCHRLARQVHVGLRLDQPQRLASSAVHASHQALVAAVESQSRTELRSGTIEPPEAGVVPRGVVIGARVAEPNQHAYRHVGAMISAARK